MKNNFTAKTLQVPIYLLIYLLLFILTLYFFRFKVGHDLHFHLIRFQSLIDALKDSSFPVYIDYDSIDGYGYASKYFYSDLLLIPFAFIGKYIGVYKAYLILINFFTLLTILISYISVRNITKNKYIAFIFSILYTFSYYRFYDLYNRAALGESICLTFLPLALWGLYEIIWGDYKKWYVISIAFTMMAFSHLLSIVMVVFIFLFILIFSLRRIWNKRIIYLFIASICTIICSSYQLFPMLEQLLDNSFYLYLKDERAVSFPVYNAEEIKYIIRGLFSGLTYVVPEIAGVGIVITFLLMIRIFLGRNLWIKKADKICLIGIICLIIVSPIYPWKIFPFSIINVIQFSWRFYTLCTLFLAFAASIYFYQSFKNNDKRNKIGIPFIFIFTSLVIVNCGQVYNNTKSDAIVYDKDKLYNYGMMGAEYLPSAVPNANTFFANRANDSVRSIENNATIVDFTRKSRIINFNIVTSKADSLELPLVYYKGYTATENGKNIPITQSKYGLVQIPIDKSGKVEVWFGGTFLQKYSIYISLLAFLLMIIYILVNNKHKRNVEKKV